MEIDQVQNEWRSRFDIDPTAGCWVWRGKPTPDGYGNVTSLRVFTHIKTNPHRMSYMVMVGEIPAGLTIDHLCRNKLCGNPDHLEAVTLAENIRRTPPYKRNAGRKKGYRALRCKRGHDLTDTEVLTPYRAGHSGETLTKCALCRYLRPSWIGPIPGWAERKMAEPRHTVD